ncbi:MAG: hypothetical protein WAZ18_01465 [Alphaproteobacteria bacterium]
MTLTPRQLSILERDTYLWMEDGPGVSPRNAQIIQSKIHQLGLSVTLPNDMQGIYTELCNLRLQRQKYPPSSRSVDRMISLGL